MEDKTHSFDHERIKPWYDRIQDVRKQLHEWNHQELTGGRALAERHLLLNPLQGVISQMKPLFSDDNNLSELLSEWQRLVHIFENIFEQTVGEISDHPFKRTL